MKSMRCHLIHIIPPLIMADFVNYFPLLLTNEGGYVFDPHDPGGETWRGIARAFNPKWTGWPLLPYPTDFSAPIRQV